MKTIPNDIWEQFFAVLKKRAVPASHHSDYRKWLRYFLDFRSKYPLPETRSEQVRLFIQKLREKKQSLEQQKQAAHALSLYFESQPRVKPVPNNKHVPTITSLVQGEGKSEGEGQRSESHYNEWRSRKKSASPAWDKIITCLAAEIKMRHYSRKTLKVYADWSCKFQGYLRNKTPDALTADDVKAYLTYLAVNCKVAASTQNQAFNALLFLYRHVLKKDFGEHRA